MKMENRFRYAAPEAEITAMTTGMTARVVIGIMAMAAIGNGMEIRTAIGRKKFRISRQISMIL